MSTNSFKVKNSLLIQPNTGAASEAGELRVDPNDDNKIKYHNGTLEDSFAMASDISDVQADISDLQTEVGTLQTDVETVQSDITQLQADVVTAQSAADAAQSDVDAHEADTSNPHAVTAAQVGLGNVDNTSDANKPVSTATQTALDLKAPKASPTFTGTVTTPLTTAGPVITNSSGVLSSEAALAISRGGTGQTTANAALNALLPSQSGNTNKVLKTDGSNTSWVAAGSGGGAKNYLGTVNGTNGNGDFELGTTTGWSLSHSSIDSTTKVPTQASGSWTSANGQLSIQTVTNSSALAGTYSLLLVSASASTVGDMLISDAFTIDQADQAKVMTFSFYYKSAQTGNYSGTSSNTWSVQIYDVTNGVWIQPAGTFGMTQSSGVGRVTGTFQTTSNSTQYRIALSCANASSGVVNLYLDDFFVGPQTAPIGPVVTDWQSYTPTGSWTSNVTYTGKWRRVGDELEAMVSVAATGAPSPAVALTVNLPSGLTIDTTKLPYSGSDFVPTGEAAYNDSGVTGYKGYTLYHSTTSILFAYQSTAGGQGTAVSPTAPITFGSSDVLTGTFKVPITGWSSNVQMSNDTDTRVVAMRATSSTNVTLAGNESYGLMAVTSKDFDTHGAYDTSTQTYTIPVSGIYRLTGSVAVMATSTGAPVAEFVWYINGAQGTHPIRTRGLVASTIEVFTITDIKQLKAGDQVQIRGAEVGTTGQVQVTGAIFAGVTINIERLSGPAVVAVSESVSARYTNTVGSSVGTSATLIPFATKSKDTHGLWNGSRFTAGISGEYEVGAAITTATLTLATNATVDLLLYKNGSFYSQIGRTVGTGGSQNVRSHGVDKIDLLAGEYIEIYGTSGTATTLLTSAGYNYVNVKRVGN